MLNPVDPKPKKDFHTAAKKSWDTQQPGCVGRGSLYQILAAPTHFLAFCSVNFPRLSCTVWAAVRLLKSFIEDKSISQLSSYIRLRGSSRRIGGLRFSLTRPVCELFCSNSRCTVGAFSLKQLDLKIYMYECSALFLLLTLISYVFFNHFQDTAIQNESVYE